MNIVGGTLRAIIAVVMIVGVVLFGVWLWRASEAWVPGAEENKCVGAETFVVKANETVQDVAYNLKKVGLVDNSYLFVLLLRLT
ncbi:MAG: hypothetical protein WCD37_13430, partial [Chloroflexia bacterium]